MRKTYLLNIEGKKRDRLLDAVKHDIRKYVRRERRRPLPDGVDYWDFDSKFGPSEAAALPVHFAALMDSVDAAAKAGDDQFFVQLITRRGQRTSRPTGDAASVSSPDEAA